MTEAAPYAKPPKGAPDQAADFLLGLPVSNITLTSIIPDGPTETATFANSDGDRVKLIKWITEQQAQRKNIYFQDCSVASVGRRPKKPDVTVIHCAHADIDVRGEFYTAESHKLALAALLAVLEGYALPPTDIICSGNGLQAYWYLATPLPATPENIAKIENINAALRDDLRGDNCQDVAHLLRVPFTVNYPNKKKLDIGRVAVRSYIVRADHADELSCYPLNSLPSKRIEPTPAQTAAEPLDIPDSVDLSRLSEADRKTIKQGTTATDRSAAVYAIASTMRRTGYSDGEIVATIINPDNGISAHILDQKQRQPEQQAMRVITAMNAKGVKLPDFEADPAPELTAEELKEQSRLRDSMAKRKAAKKKRLGNILSGLRVIRGGSIKIENIRFLWQYVLARGIHTVFAGEGGEGKSQITYNNAANIVIQGGKFPDGKPAQNGSIVFLNAEDNTNQMYGPRLRAAIKLALGPNATEGQITAAMDRTYRITATASAEGESKFSLHTDLERLKELCEQINADTPEFPVVLIVIDPASSYMGGALDSRNNTQIRNVLDPISQLAEDLDIAVLSINHFNKGVSDKAKNKVLDSVANVNAPRAVWGTFSDTDPIEGIADDARKLFVQIKTNIAPEKLPGYSYKMIMSLAGNDERTGEAVMAPCIKWTGRTSMSADEIMAIESQKNSPLLTDAMTFLQREIADKDPPPFVEDVISAAKAEGITTSTIGRAKRRLRIKAIPPESGGGPWRWTLPKAESPALIFDDENSPGAIPEAEGEFEP